jgi:hypothetical protein
MLARGSHNIILLNSCNKFSIELTLIQYPLYIGTEIENFRLMSCLFILCRLENDVKRLKTDLQISRNTEQELKSQINSFICSDKNTRSELYQLQQDNENLQNK